MAEFIVNPDETTGGSIPDVTALADGRFVVTWRTDGGSGDNYISARIYNADGSAAGAAFTVATTASDLTAPSVTALADGGFVFAWRSEDGGDGDGNLIRLRAFAADGTPVSDDAVANTVGTGAQDYPTIAALDDGGYVVAWQSNDLTEDTLLNGIRARIYAADGTALDADFLVNTTTTGAQLRPGMTTLEDGNFLVTWQSNDATDGQGIGIRARLFAPDGTALGSDFLVNTTGNGSQTVPTATALAGGGFVVTWQSGDGGDGGGTATDPCIRARLFAADGTALGADFIVNSSGTNGQNSPVVTALDTGGFLVVWDSRDGGDGGTTSEYLVRGRVYDEDGNALGLDFVVNTTTAGDQRYVSATTLADGTVAVTWASDDSGSFYIHGTVLDLAVENEAPTSLALSADTVAEDAATGTVVGVLSATDPEGGALTYALTDDAGGKFALVTGGNGTVSLVVDGALDYETATSHAVTVEVTDADGASTSQIFTIDVTDVDEGGGPVGAAPTDITFVDADPPESFTNSQAFNRVSISEGLAVGAAVTRLTATDADSTDRSFSLVDDAEGRFAIQVIDGVATVVVASALDFETDPIHSLTVRVTDEDGNSYDEQIQIAVQNEVEGDEGEMITIDASGSTGMDFDEYMATVAIDRNVGLPDMNDDYIVSRYADGTYAAAFGSDVYYEFSTHTIGGTFNTLWFGTVDNSGAGASDMDPMSSYTTELQITGLDWSNSTDESSEAEGLVHNYTSAYLYGTSSAGDPRFDLVADGLDQYAQNFIGSSGADSFTGASHDDVVEGGGGNDVLGGGLGEDTAVFSGNLADYTITNNGDGTFTVADNRSGANDGTDTLSNIEEARFADTVYVFEDVDDPPVDLDLSASSVAEDAAVGTVVGLLSAVDPEGGALTYTLTDDADGRFALQVASNGIVSLVVAGALDFETAESHAVTVKVTDEAGNELERTFDVEVTDVANGGGGDGAADGAITIDASGAAAMNFDAYVTGGFLQGTSVAGFPTFDNSAEFEGSQMMISYGSGAATDKYVTATGDLGYAFSSHTVHGVVNTVEFGTRGTGTFSADGAFVGGSAELRITGLSFQNALTPEVDVEANGAVHNFASAYMYGAAGSAARLAAFSEDLDDYAQSYIGAAGADRVSTSNYEDALAGNGGDDVLEGRGGDDDIDGGAGEDTAVFTGRRSQYEISRNEDGSLAVVDSVAGRDAADRLVEVEFLQFSDVTVRADSIGTPPEELTLSGSRRISENAAVGTLVGVLAATDPEGDDLTYALSENPGGYFEVVGNELRVAANIDYETVRSIDLLLQAFDAEGNAANLTATITVLDVFEPIAGGAGDDVLVGTGGDDRLEGGAGDDVLNGGGGADRMLGGAGDDTYFVNHAGDRVVERGGEGYDTVKSSVDVKLPRNVEKLVLFGDGDIAGTGNGGDNLMRGNGGDNTLGGRGGTDTLYGRAGDDALAGGNGADRLRGGEGGDVLVGGRGDDRLFADSGRDVLTGGRGADRFLVVDGGEDGLVDAAVDRLLDFDAGEGDRIVLRRLGDGGGRFDFLGEAAFTGEGGKQVRVERAGADLLVHGDIDGDGVADVTLRLEHTQGIDRDAFLL